MRSDGSLRDEYPDKNTKRFTPGIPHVMISTPSTHERIWKGNVIRFANVANILFVMLQDVRDATNYNCHCNSEGKGETVCIINGARYVATNEFTDRTLRVYPKMRKNAEGAAFIEWVNSGFKDSRAQLHNKPQLFFATKNKKKREANNQSILNAISTNILELLQNTDEGSFRDELIQLMESVAHSTERTVKAA